MARHHSSTVQYPRRVGAYTTGQMLLDEEKLLILCQLQRKKRSLQLQMQAIELELKLENKQLHEESQLMQNSGLVGELLDAALSHPYLRKTLLKRHLYCCHFRGRRGVGGNTIKIKSNSKRLKQNHRSHEGASGNYCVENHVVASLLELRRGRGGSNIPSVIPSGGSLGVVGNGNVVQLSQEGLCHKRGPWACPVAAPSDRTLLSKYQVLLRESLEFFTATTTDLSTPQQGRRNKVRLHQVGIRCKHCAVAQKQSCGRPKGAQTFPRTVSAMYRSAQTIASAHLAAACPCVPQDLRQGRKNVLPL